MTTERIIVDNRITGTAKLVPAIIDWSAVFFAYEIEHEDFGRMTELCNDAGACIFVIDSPITHALEQMKKSRGFYGNN